MGRRRTQTVSESQPDLDEDFFRFEAPIRRRATSCSHDHLPEWLKDNEYLLDGHRPPLESYVECAKTVTQIHGETGNIWTHLLGAILFLGLLVKGIVYPDPGMGFYDHVVFGVYYVGAITCFILSTAFHTFRCHSHGVSNMFCKLDYVGITIMVVASFVPSLYYAFYHNPAVRMAYMMITLFLASCCVVVSMFEKFGSREYRATRAGVFLFFGLSGLAPFVHYALTYGIFHEFFQSFASWHMLMACFYLSGATLYALRIPERLAPGKFDIWAQSHTLFHICVLVGAIIHLQANYVAFSLITAMTDNSGTLREVAI